MSGVLRARVTRRAAATLVVVAVAPGCGATTSGDEAEIDVAAAQSPADERLFHRDPRWLGSDGAYSVPLRDGRILWLFGDTFVATTARHVRSESKFVRNTVAIQSGADPRRADAQFYWRMKSEGPASFFPESGGAWFWPKHGIRLGRALVIFLSRVVREPAEQPGLGFRGAGWRLAVVDDATKSPDHWRIRLVAPTTGPRSVTPGESLTRSGEYVLSLATGAEEEGPGRGYLARWRAQDLAAGRVDAAEWWVDGSWKPAAELRRRPTAIIERAGPEASLHFDRQLDRWILVRTEGFGAATLEVSFASRIEGPWSAPRAVFRPAESDRPRVFVYAGEAHPELAGKGLAVTYATNTQDDLGTLIRDTSLYYPRFVRLTFSKP